MLMGLVCHTRYWHCLPIVVFCVYIGVESGRDRKVLRGGVMVMMADGNVVSLLKPASES
jgi:hypothetical protein